MGSSESKLKIKSEKQDVDSVKNFLSTPQQGAKLKTENLSNLDPRSPSDNVIRTPIEVYTESTLHEKEDNTITSLICTVDPRSPTDQFTRTPIIIESNNSSQPPTKLHNKILDNARRSLLYSPTVSSRTHKELEHPTCIQTPPKLLESSPFFKKVNNRKSFVGVLETNIDYTETNLDDYVKSKALNSSLTVNVNENNSVDDLKVCENYDPRSPSTDFLRTPIQILTKVQDIQINNPMNNNFTENQISATAYNEAESLLKVVDMNPSENHLSDGYTESDDELNEICNEQVDDIRISEMNKHYNNLQENDESTDTLPVKEGSLQVSITEDVMNDVPSLVENTEPNDVLKSEPLELNQIIDLTVDVQEFDRKLTKIIRDHEDTKLIRKTAKLNEIEQPRNRTPMKDRNIIAEPKKNRLKVSDKPRKLEYAVSKIPVFRENGGKLKIQCENTPPKNMDRRKKKSQHAKWDSEKTLVI